MVSFGIKIELEEIVETGELEELGKLGELAVLYRLRHNLMWKEKNEDNFKGI